jgi:hypothetical protein
MARDDAKDGTDAPAMAEETWPALESIEDAGSESDLISPAELIRYFDRQHHRTPDVVADGDEEVGDTSRLPRVLRMPDGIRVDERRVGRAVAQWILHVRCECGRRWFEVEPIDTTTCPRCGALVYVDIDARSQRK